MSVKSGAQAKSLSIVTKIAVVTIVVVLAAVGVSYWVFMAKYKGSAREDMVKRAEAFTAVAEETKNNTASLHTQGAFDVNAMLPELQETISKGGKYSDTRMFKTVPVVAGWLAAEQAAKKENIDFHVVAFQARNKEHEPESGSFRHTLLTDLTAQVKGGGQMTISRVDEKTNTLHFMRAIELDTTCMTCHGDPAQYDTKDKDGKFDGKDPVGFTMESWKPGDMHGAYEVAIPLSKMDENVAGFFKAGMMATVPVVALLIGSFLYLLRRLLGKPLGKMVTVINDMTQGSKNLDQRVDDARGDELGRLGSAFNQFVADLNASNAESARQSQQIKQDAAVLMGKVESMLKVTDAAGRGDLTRAIDVTGDDAMGRLAQGFRVMIENISSLLRETSTGSSQIDAGAQQISSASQSLAAGASEQAASLEEISASLEEITSMTSQNADNAQQAATLASTAHEAAGKGKKETQELATAMEQIQDSSTKISAIIKTIDDIAFQTNPLALNAAVEAARAGEAGKGFAVVAEEVRNLAQRSAEAAKNTSGMIQESRERASAGVQISQRVGAALEEIVGGVAKVNTLLSEIASASREQAQGVSQVNKGVSELDKVTQQNAGNSEELASAAEETASQVACLRDLIARFKVEGQAEARSAAKLVRPSAAAIKSGKRTASAPKPAKAATEHLDHQVEAAANLAEAF